jgi:hypothetical protein
MQAINKQAIWSRNHHGRVYKKGVGEEGLWCCNIGRKFYRFRAKISLFDFEFWHA